jgi:hypothetical protein
MKKKNQALKLTILLLVFLAPFFAALFVYQARDGIHFMTKNAGTLIRPTVHFETLGTLPPERRWWMVYYSDAGCDAACEKALSHFETIRQSLIEDSPRLGVILITKTQIHTVPFKGVYETEFLGPLPEGLPSEHGRAIWLMDPLGNIILSYDPVVLDNRLLLDLRHLLKVSRIG